METTSCAFPVVARMAVLAILLSQAPLLLGRKPEIPPVPCGDRDLTGLTLVNVTPGVKQVKLLATGIEACENAADVAECTADWNSKEARKAGRQLGSIVAHINAVLQKVEVEKYENLMKAAKTALANSTTNSTTNSTSDADPEPFDVVEEPPADLNLTEAETTNWKAAANKLKAKRSKGKPNPKGQPDQDGFSQQLKYVCHKTDDRTVMLYMSIGECTTQEPCNDLDEVEWN